MKPGRLSSLPCDAKRAAHASRSHWSVDNTLHRVLDMSFREASRVRKGRGHANWLSLHIALTLPKLAKSLDASSNVERKRAGGDNDFLLRLKA